MFLTLQIREVLVKFVRELCCAIRQWPLVAAAGALLIGLGGALPSAAEAQETILVMIGRVQALDKIDLTGKADFLARVTIAGETFVSPVIKGQDVIEPNWLFKKTVGPGLHNVKIEILDKDVVKQDLVDINRVKNKRDLDFQVDTRNSNCMVLGFSEPYECGEEIRRAGDETKRGEITFSAGLEALPAKKAKKGKPKPIDLLK